MPFDHGFMAVTVAFEPTVGVGEICPTESPRVQWRASSPSAG